MSRKVAISAFDRMSELLLEKKLRESAEEDEVRIMAYAWTLIILRRLDAIRTASTLKFLHRSGLIDKNKRIIDLRTATLSGADLNLTDLSGADLSGADLSRANLKDVIGITIQNLEKQARSLTGATMPDGSKHP